MYNNYRTCPYPYYNDSRYNAYNTYPCPYFFNEPMYDPDFSRQFDDSYIPFENEMEYDWRSDVSESPEEDRLVQLKDYGPAPFVIDINEATKQNNTFRTALWTGTHLQVTLMSIDVGGDIGLEIHSNVDQFIRVEEGEGIVRMGKNSDNMDFEAEIYDDSAIMIPAGTWHNITNTGNIPLKVYSIYAPPQHPRGTVHRTKADAEAAEKEHC